VANTSGRRKRGPVWRARRRRAAMGRPGRIVTAVLAALVGLFVAFAALGTILSACGAGQKKPQAPVRSSASSTAPSRAASVAPPPEPVRTRTATPSPSHPRTPTPTVTVTTTQETSEAPSNPYVYYKDCDAARAAGAAPLHRGDPGYRSELDRDGDGVACEPYNR
jgi:hypothetical protein